MNLGEINFDEARAYLEKNQPIVKNDEAWEALVNAEKVIQKEVKKIGRIFYEIERLREFDSGSMTDLEKFRAIRECVAHQRLLLSKLTIDDRDESGRIIAFIQKLNKKLNDIDKAMHDARNN